MYHHHAIVWVPLVALHLLNMELAFIALLIALHIFLSCFNCALLIATMGFLNEVMTKLGLNPTRPPTDVTPV